VLGDRTVGEEVSYPDIDLAIKPGPDGKSTHFHKDGRPYPPLPRD
jgi:uncharacterized cupin superfamily protein